MESVSSQGRLHTLTELADFLVEHDYDGTHRNVATPADVDAVEESVARVDPGVTGGPGERIGFDGVGTPLLLRSPFSIRSFGPIGTADDTNTVQAALSGVDPNSIIEFPQIVPVEEVTLDTEHITLHGPGGLGNGKLIIGTVGGGGDLYFTFDGVSFTRDTLDVGSSAIEVLKGRRGTIHKCFFQNFEKAISVPPEATGSHTVGIIKIHLSEFANVDYALHADAATWDTCSDWKFVENIINLARKCQVWVSGIDGIDVSSNTMFSLSYTSTDTAALALKEQNIYIGQSDWVTVQSNKLFEAGLEAVKLDSPKIFDVSHNAVAWPGQRVPSDAIAITGTSAPRGKIMDNGLDRFTKHGIGIYGVNLAGHIVVHDNPMVFDVATPTYYGATALSSIDHYSVFQDTASTNKVDHYLNPNAPGTTLRPKIQAGTTSRVSIPVTERLAYSGGYISKSVTAANTVICQLTSGNGNTSNFDGQVMISARNDVTDTANLAAYILHVVKSSAGQVVNALSSQGMTTGAAATHPSFTFSMDASGNLLASPVASTTGTFYFYLTYQGNIRTV